MPQLHCKLLQFYLTKESTFSKWYVAECEQVNTLWPSILFVKKNIRCFDVLVFFFFFFLCSLTWSSEEERQYRFSMIKQNGEKISSVMINSHPLWSSKKDLLAVSYCSFTFFLFVYFLWNKKKIYTHIYIYRIGF